MKIGLIWYICVQLWPFAVCKVVSDSDLCKKLPTGRRPRGLERSVSHKTKIQFCTDGAM